MRRAYALTFVFAVISGAFTYACSDETEPLPSNEPGDGGTGRDSGNGGRDGQSSDDDPPTDDGGSPHDGDASTEDADSPDALDASDDAPIDGGDEEVDGGPPPPHTVVVLRVGELDGGALSAGAAQVFLDEYELRKNTLVRTIRLPTEANGDHRPLVQSTTLIREGSLSTTEDGRAVVVAGYTGYPDDGTGPWTSRPADIPRVVARVTADGRVDTTTLISDSFGANYVGGATISGTDVWIGGNAGSGGPVQYLRFGNSVGGGATTGTQIIAPFYAHTCLRIFEGQLYAAASNYIIYQVGTGLPTTGNQVETAIVEDAIGAFEFEFVDMDGQPGAERLYIAVDGIGGIPGGVRKYVYDDAEKKWTFSTTLRDDPTSGLRGLTAYKDGDDVIVAATSPDGKRLVRIVDPAVGAATSTVIATAPDGVMYRGVTRAPKP